MKKAKNTIRSLPEEFRSLEEFQNFWDTHSTVDYEQEMEPAEFEVELEGSQRVYCPVSRRLVEQIQAIARREGVSAEVLVARWLQEKLSETLQRAG